MYRLTFTGLNFPHDRPSQYEQALACLSLNMRELHCTGLSKAAIQTSAPTL